MYIELLAKERRIYMRAVVQRVSEASVTVDDKYSWRNR